MADTLPKLLPRPNNFTEYFFFLLSSTLCMRDVEITDSKVLVMELVVEKSSVNKSINRIKK